MSDELIKQLRRNERMSMTAWARDDFKRAADLIEQQAARLAAREAAEKENGELLTALAECRDAFPIPEPGSHVEGHWAGAIGDPLEIPFYVHACLEAASKDAIRREALEEMPDGVAIASYCLTGDPDVTVQRSRQQTGPDLWAVRCGGNCLGKDGKWEWEPLPSSRDDAFLSNCRFVTAREAIADAIRALSQQQPGK